MSKEQDLVIKYLRDIGPAQFAHEVARDELPENISQAMKLIREAQQHTLYSTTSFGVQS